ncbi:MAG TPA: hypothetical protein VEL51_21915 [Vicinamibacterales bacterium]|nr:hypothetical protein [Vicinamibacterales bacterium]
MASVRLPHRLVAFLIIVLAALACALLLRAPVARASAQEVVSLSTGSAVHLATPPFLVAGRRYAFTWPGGGPPQTFTVKQIRQDGWVLVEVADENTRIDLYVPGEFPTRWLHAALAVSIQEMRPLP